MADADVSVSVEAARKAAAEKAKTFAPPSQVGLANADVVDAQPSADEGRKHLASSG